MITTTSNEKVDRATAKAIERKGYCHWYALGRLDQVAAERNGLGSSDVAMAFATGQYATAFAYYLGSEEAGPAMYSIQDAWEAFIATWRG